MSSKLALVSAVCVFLAAPATVRALTLQVHCDQPTSKLPTINSALKVLSGPIGNLGPNTINVTGACVENVFIEDFNYLTINAVDGASISDNSNGASNVVSVYNSPMVVISGFTINGSGPTGKDAVNANHSEIWLNGDTIQNARNGVTGYGNTGINISGGILQNNATGLNVYNGAKALLSVDSNVVIQNNTVGVALQAAAHVQASTATIRNNSGPGVRMLINATFTCDACSITGNGANGVGVFEGSSVLFSAFRGPYVVTNNALAGVYLSELASANFSPGGNVAANASGTDVNCGPQFTTARGATINIGGGTTNCVEPQP
jgi:parallel beta helix pectate lyase-like protein